MMFVLCRGSRASLCHGARRSRCRSASPIGMSRPTPTVCHAIDDGMFASILSRHVRDTTLCSSVRLTRTGRFRSSAACRTTPAIVCVVCRQERSLCYQHIAIDLFVYADRVRTVIASICNEGETRGGLFSVRLSFL
jgi:hypothetical protein